MKRIASFCLSFITCGIVSAAEDQTSKDISQAGIQTAFRILQKEYIRSDDLTFDELNRAALAGLLHRLDFGAELIPKDLESVPEALQGVQAEILSPKIAYLRPQAFTAAETAALEKALQQFDAAKVEHVILDLRTPSQPGSFDQVAEVLSLFAPQGEVLFKMKQIGQSRSEAETSRRAPVWSKPLLVLADEETGSLGETLAAVLRQRKQALLIGGPTRGATVRYETVPVDAQWSLRFARAEVLLADDTSVFKKGLEPDFVVPFMPSAKRHAFEVSREKDVKATITDKPRARFNEAALVSKTNPELDAYIRRSSGSAQPEAASLPTDVVLQRAVDLLKAHDHFQGAKMDWKRPAASAKEPQPPRAIPVGN